MKIIFLGIIVGTWNNNLDSYFKEEGVLKRGRKGLRIDGMILIIVVVFP